MLDLYRAGDVVYHGEGPGTLEVAERYRPINDGLAYVANYSKPYKPLAYWASEFRPKLLC